MFFYDIAGNIRFLDTIEAAAEIFAPDTEVLWLKLSDTEVRSEIFLTDLLHELELSDKTLPKDTLYTFVVPPMLGGKLVADNVEVYDISVAISVTAQLSRQIKDKPDGWQPGEFTFKDSSK